MPAPTDGTKTSLLTDGVTAQTTDEVMARRGAGNVRLTIAYIKTAVLSGLGIAWSAITGKPSTFPPDVHTHVEADTTGLIADLALKAPLASPALTGVPTVPTAAPGTNTTQAASTAFVAAADTLHAALTTSAHGGIVASSDSRLTDSRTPTAHAGTHASAGSDPLTLAESQITNLVADLALKAALASPTFTGTPAAPTAAGGTSTTQLATTAFVQGAVTGGSVADGDKGDVTVSGGGTIWTVDALPESRITNLVTDLALKAPLASPALTGVPAAPTAAPGTNTTQLATTAFAAAAAALDLKIASNLSDLANAGTARTNLGLGALATLASITASLISDASVNGRSLVTATDYAAMRTLLALVIGTNVQAWDADLDAIAALTTTSFGRSYLALADAAAGRALAGSAPLSATYITQTANSELSTEQALGALASGYLKNTTTTGVLSVQATPIPVADGGTNATSAGAALTSLGAAPLASPTFTGTPAAPTAAADTNTTQLATTAYVIGQKGTANPLAPGTAAAGTSAKWTPIDHVHPIIGSPAQIGIAVSDETTVITTGTAKLTFRMPYAMTLTSVRASLKTASSSGIPAIDLNEAGVSVFSTTLTIDANEKTSQTAATAAVISDSALADDAEMTVDIDTAGTGAVGLKLWLIGTRA